MSHSVMTDYYLNYYLRKQERIAVWGEFAKATNPKQFPLKKVITYLINMSLDKLVNIGGFFQRDKAIKLLVSKRPIKIIGTTLNLRRY